MSKTETERLALAERKIEELQGDLRGERDRSFGMRKQLEAAAHDAASLESRLTRMLRTIEGSYHLPSTLTVDDIEVLIEVRELRMHINSKITAAERKVFDRLYEVLDRLLVRRPVS